MRLRQFLKGAFLYNTIYWRRASDDLDIQRMSREERASMRPKRNLDIIRPRENPRPTTGGSTLSLPAAEVSEPLRPAPVLAESENPADPPRPPAAEAQDDGVEVHRRKKRRRSRHSKVMPKQYYDPAHESSGGIFSRLFRK